ncbi:MAG: hypothetical protein IIB42_06585, partial [Candidatus Marinimicrobia bacterium]|nr:hypothetical protein [Candidatus Neomarinimicrobiota bacterium]
MVVEEMEMVALALLEEKISNTDEAFAVLMRGIVQLPDYLGRLQSGHRDIPVVLLPLPPRGGGLIRRHLDGGPQRRQGIQQADLGGPSHQPFGAKELLRVVPARQGLPEVIHALDECGTRLSDVFGQVKETRL